MHCVPNQRSCSDENGATSRTLSVARLMRPAPRAAPFSGGGVVANPKLSASLSGAMSDMAMFRKQRADYILGFQTNYRLFHASALFMGCHERTRCLAFANLAAIHWTLTVTLKPPRLPLTW